MQQKIIVFFQKLICIQKLEIFKEYFALKI